MMSERVMDADELETAVETEAAAAPGAPSGGAPGTDGFAALGLGAAALRGVATAGFEAATPIQVEAILQTLPAERQTALFSATIPPPIAALSRTYLRNPARVAIEPKQRTVSLTRQTYYEVLPAHKVDALSRILDMETPGSTIVFC